MSLKLFHIAFITISSLSAAGFAAWCLLTPNLPGMFQIMGWLSVVGAIALVVYGIRFYKKAKSVIT